MQEKLPFGILRASVLIAGNTIGVGMLGIPLVTAIYGFWYATLITCIVWALLLVTGFFLLEVSLAQEDGVNFITLSKKYLGKCGALFTTFGFLFLYYFLMVAYVTGGAPIFGRFITNILGVALPIGGEFVLFTALFAIIVGIGPRSIDGANFIATALMMGFFVLLLVFGLPHISLDNLFETKTPLCFLAAPILFSAFGYHNMIPSLVTYLQKDKKALQKSLVIGSSLVLIIYLFWQVWVIGSVPIEAIEEAAKLGKPATETLYKEGPLLFISLEIFAFFAIITSMLGLSFSLIDFLADGLSLRNRGWHRILLTLVVFSFPLFTALMHPMMFDKALGLAGGIGSACMNGVFPILLIWSFYRGKERWLFGFSLFIMVCVIGIEVYNLLTPM